MMPWPLCKGDGFICPQYTCQNGSILARWLGRRLVQLDKDEHMDGLFGQYMYDDPSTGTYMSLLKQTVFSMCCDIKQSRGKIQDDQHLEYFATVCGGKANTAGLMPCD